MEGSFVNAFNALSVNQQDDITEALRTDVSQDFELQAIEPQSIEPLNIDTINFDDDKEFQPVKRNRAKPDKSNKPAKTTKPKVETDVITDNIDDSSLTHSFKLSNIVNSTTHYLELAKEGINCMAGKALRNIQSRQDKIQSGCWSMNILGPIFCNDFYVRFDSKRYALVKEDIVQSGKIELDGKEYPINSQDSIRVWDLICGPNDKPTLFKDNNMLSLGEKLQDIIQANVRRDLIADGLLRPEDKYTPTVWLFLAYRYNFKDQQKPCRFINMCWNSDGTAPKSLIKVEDYHVRNTKPRQVRTFDQHRPLDNRPQFDNRQHDTRRSDARHNDNRQFDNRRPDNNKTKFAQHNRETVPRFKPFAADKKE